MENELIIKLLNIHMVHKDHPMSTSEYICYLLVQRFTIKWVVRNSNLNMMLKKTPFPFFFILFFLLLAFACNISANIYLMYNGRHTTHHNRLYASSTEVFLSFHLAYIFVHTLNVSFFIFLPLLSDCTSNQWNQRKFPTF